MNRADWAILRWEAVDDAELFRRQMVWLAASPIEVVPLAEALVHGPAEPSVALTFDGGHRGFFDRALPLLLELRFMATIFLHAEPPAGYLDWSEARAIRDAGVAIGSMGRSGASLTGLPAAAIEEDLRVSRTELEDRLGVPVSALAYPGGRLDATVRTMAARHYQLAVTRRLGYAAPADDRYRLPRLDARYLRYRFDQLHTEAGRSHMAVRAFLQRLFEPGLVR